MLISNTKKKNGTVYPYFVCSGRHRRCNDCKSRYILIGEVERKIYVSCSKEVPLEIEEQYNPPFNVIIEPFKEELAKLNRSIRANTEAALAKIATAKNRILKTLRCGLAACSDTRNMESYSNSNFLPTKVRVRNFW